MLGSRGLSRGAAACVAVPAAAVMALGCGGSGAGCCSSAPQTSTTSTTGTSDEEVSQEQDGVLRTSGGGWVRRLGGAGGDWAWNVATDPEGRILLTGYFEQTGTFGGEPLVATEDEHGFVASYEANGEHRWSRLVAAATPMTFSDDGEVTVAAFGGGEHPGALTRHSATGEPSPARPLPVDTGWANTAVPAADGAFHLAGSFADGVRVGETTPSSNGGDDAIVVSTTAEGEPRWVRAFGSPGDDTTRGLVVDPDGNVYVTGSFSGDLILGDETVRSGGELDIYVASFAPDGEPRWLRRYGAEGHDEPNDLVLADGQLYVTGHVRRAGTYHGGRPTFYDDVFLASLSTAGEERWSHRYETRSGTGHDLAHHAQHGLCLAGSFSGGVRFGAVSLSVPDDPSRAEIPGGGEPESDAFVACFDPSGEARWARRFGGQGGDGAWALASGEDGRLIVAGYFADTVDFDGVSLSARGDSDVFLLSLSAAAAGD